MPIIGVILAGGRSRRMAGPGKSGDKALAKLAGKSLFDHVLNRLAPQVDRVMVSGRSDYGSGLAVMADIPGGAEGPVAGIRAAYDRLAGDGETATAIVTTPVDCPFLPGDLVARLSGLGAAAIAEGDDHLQPAFGYWPMAVVAAHIEALERPGWLSLQRWAKICDAETVVFDQPGAFFNINSPDDLAAAELLVAGQRKNASG
ncbi:MAG: molybdenum cofactor guanylyltransferase [Proteobacteria bacterium]|nr:molybdenum cofactor guanylyltransferase [Pseudomonadota bacterium]